MRRLVLLLLLFVPAAAAWTWPVQGPVLQTFSFDPAHPYGAGQHRGIAIGAGDGAPVLAPTSGVVSFAGTVPTNGKTLTIQTPSGLAVSLTHLGSIDVAQRCERRRGRAPSAPSARAARPSSTCRTCTSAYAKRRTTRAISIRSRSCRCSRRPTAVPPPAPPVDVPAPAPSWTSPHPRRSSLRRSRSKRPRPVVLSGTRRRGACGTGRASRLRSWTRLLRRQCRRRAGRRGCGACRGRAVASRKWLHRCPSLRRRPPPRVRRTCRLWQRPELSRAPERPNRLPWRCRRLGIGRFACTFGRSVCRTCDAVRAAGIAPRPLPAARPVSTLRNGPAEPRPRPATGCSAWPSRSWPRPRPRSSGSAGDCRLRPSYGSGLVHVGRLAGGSQYDAVLIMEVCVSISRLRSTTSTRRRTSVTPTRRRWATCSCATTPSVGTRPSSSPASTSTRRRSGGSPQEQGLEPQEYADRIAVPWRELPDRLNASDRLLHPHERRGAQSLRSGLPAADLRQRRRLPGRLRRLLLRRLRGVQVRGRADGRTGCARST